MNVIVACEFSGTVRDAFLRRGHYAMSCDLLPTEVAGPHFQGDIRDLPLQGFDLMVAHPPCTHLAVCGAHLWPKRRQEQQEALAFVDWLLNAPVPRIALENPVGRLSTAFRKPDQIIHPWMFGHGETKATCLWLQNLPPLIPTNIVPERKPITVMMPPSKDRQKMRSLTFEGIAEAMAEQWGAL